MEKLDLIYLQCKKLVEAYDFQEKLNFEGYFALEPAEDMESAIEKLKVLLLQYPE